MPSRNRVFAKLARWDSSIPSGFRQSRGEIGDLYLAPSKNGYCPAILPTHDSGGSTVTNNAISIVKALSLAGDITDYGNRKRVLVIRRNGDAMEYGIVDFL